MNLSRLMDRGVPPPVIADALIQRFERVEQHEIASGGWPYQYLFAAGDSERPRLLVLFAWFGSGWQYYVSAPQHIPRLRLCAGQ